MRKPHTLFVASLALVVPLALAACKQEASKPAAPTTTAPSPTPPVSAPAPLRVSNIELGNAIGSDKRVSLPKTSFAPTDTIYASVTTEGQASNATLTARWTYGDEDQVVKEDTLTISPSGAATSEFHVAKPDGWPPGKYKVEILANGASAGSKQFEVAD